MTLPTGIDRLRYLTTDPNTSRESWSSYQLQTKRRLTGIPQAHWYRSLGDLPLASQRETVFDVANGTLEWCLRWHHIRSAEGRELDRTDVPQHRDGTWRGKGLWLSGAPGVGKTTMACVVANYLSDLGWATKFMKVTDWAAEKSALMDLPSNDDETAQLRYLATLYGEWSIWPLVVIDDIGKEYRKRSDFLQVHLNGLIRHRWDLQAPTIVTTNIPMKEVAEIYGESTASLLNEAFEGFEIPGEDQRKVDPPAVRAVRRRA